MSVGRGRWSPWEGQRPPVTGKEALGMQAVNEGPGVH